MKHHLKIITVLMAVLLIAAVMTGCKKAVVSDKPAEQPASSETTQPAEVKPAEPDANKIPEPYAQVIEEYDKGIGSVEVTTQPAAEDVQKAAVDTMKQLVRSSAPSDKIFALYQKEIEGLRVPYSDEFAKYALSGLRRNSFEDYKPYEAYFGNMAKLDIYFNEYEKYGSSLELTRNRDKIEDVKTKELAQLAHDSGYVMETAEGMVFPVVDYTQFAKYKAIYSPGFTAILEQLAYDNVEVSISDAGLRVSRDRILARALQAEVAMEAAKGNENGKFITMLYINDLGTLLHGTDNSPNFDYETMLLSKEVSDLYQQIIRLEGTKTALYINKHLEGLKAAGNKYDESVYSNIDTIKKQVKSDFQVSESDEKSYTDWMSGEFGK